MAPAERGNSARGRRDPWVEDWLELPDDGFREPDRPLYGDEPPNVGIFAECDPNASPFAHVHLLFRDEVGDTGMALGKAHRLKKPSGAGSTPAASIQDGAAVPQSLLIGLPRSIGRSSATHNAGSRDWRLHAPIRFYREGLSVSGVTLIPFVYNRPMAKTDRDNPIRAKSSTSDESLMEFMQRFPDDA